MESEICSIAERLENEHLKIYLKVSIPVPVITQCNPPGGAILTVRYLSKILRPLKNGNFRSLRLPVRIQGRRKFQPQEYI
jgi:hypothetical protein